MVTDMAEQHHKWDMDPRVFQHVRLFCLHCRQSTTSLGNARIHIPECRGLADVFLACGCCGTTFHTWKSLYHHVNQGGFHRREALPGYDGTVESIMAAPQPAASATSTTEDYASTGTTSSLDLDSLHEIFLEPPSSPEPILQNVNSPPTPAINFCLAQATLQTPDTVDLGLSLAELDQLLQQFPISEPQTEQHNPSTPALACPPFPNRMVDCTQETNTPSFTPSPLSAAAPPPNPLNSPTFTPCTRALCNMLLTEATYYKDNVQLVAVTIALVQEQMVNLAPYSSIQMSPRNVPTDDFCGRAPGLSS